MEYPQVFNMKSHICNGLTIDTQELSLLDTEFERSLCVGIGDWKKSGIKKVWFKVNIENSKYIPILIKHGFLFHQAALTYAVLSRSLTADEPDLLRQFPNTFTGPVSSESVYSSKLGVLETFAGVKVVKDTFESLLSSKLNLEWIPAPLFVETSSGLNDDLNGYERPVALDLKSGIPATVVQSLAKWKRMALKKYNFGMHSGLYTNMNAIRKDEDLSPLHSYYVDQWDWEMVIGEEDRNIEYLKSVVKDIYECMKQVELHIIKTHPSLSKKLPEDIAFVSSQEMESEYPNLSPKERETMYTRKYGAIFITQIGKTLKSGQKHDGRAPDYDDWDLNGDIIVHHPQLDTAFELSSMGIRVSKDSLSRQLNELGCESRLELPFHKALIDGELPFSIGGGIGQSRLCMLLLDKMHIGEVQVSVWSKGIIKECNEKGIQLLQ